ncbi:hypothetical protein NC651_022745 [Populus alba x Populus x berolinensis]|nr:hypothetical protein NC651_022745 [Populus alba x Populus x berolinensis]
MGSDEGSCLYCCDISSVSFIATATAGSIKIQDAIDSVPSNNPELVFIWVSAENIFGSGGKASVQRVSGDRAAFYGCGILSYRDALLDGTGSHYYSNCYIEGATDFICGNAASLFEPFTIQAILIAQDRPQMFLFKQHNHQTDISWLWFMHCHSELQTGWGLKQHLSSRMDKAQINLSSLHLKTSLPASIQNQPSQFGMFEKDG